MNSQKFGTIIREQRIQLKMTQKELADFVGVTDKAVSKWELGKSFPDITLIEVIANALHLTIEELVCASSITRKESMENRIIKKRIRTRIIVALIIFFVSIILVISYIIAAPSFMEIKRIIKIGAFVVFSLIETGILLPCLQIMKGTRNEEK